MLEREHRRVCAKENDTNFQFKRKSINNASAKKSIFLSVNTVAEFCALFSRITYTSAFVYVMALTLTAVSAVLQNKHKAQITASLLIKSLLSNTWDTILTCTHCLITVIL